MSWCLKKMLNGVYLNVYIHINHPNNNFECPCSLPDILCPQDK